MYARDMERVALISLDKLYNSINCNIIIHMYITDNPCVCVTHCLV